MSDMVGLPFPDQRKFLVRYQYATEGPGDHIRNGLMLLGALRRVLPVCGRRHADAFALVDAISARLDKALQQVEGR